MAMPNPSITQDEVNTILWKSLSIFRNIAAPSESKNYILVMLFLKFISDVRGDPKIAEDERLLIPEGCDFYALGRESASPDLGDTINKALARIEEANSSLVKGVLSQFDFNNPRIGDTYHRNHVLRDLIDNLSQLDFHSSASGEQNPAGEAFSYLLNRIATDKNTEIVYTPAEVSSLLASLTDPRPGEQICDPACGTGSILIKCKQYVESEYSSNDYKLYGQEVDPTIWALCKLNMILHGAAKTIVEQGDTLGNPQLLERGQQLFERSRMMQFDVVVSEPPTLPRYWNFEQAVHDPFNRFPPTVLSRSNASFAFIFHIISSLQPSHGRAAVVVSGSLLFGRNTARIREYLVNENLLDAIIKLPPNLFPSTAITLYILVLKRHREQNEIIYIDASQLFEEAGTRNKLRTDSITRIATAYRERQVIENLSYRVSVDEIQANDFDLTFSRYAASYALPEQRFSVSKWSGPHDIFISYSHADKAAVDNLGFELVAAGLRVWIDDNLEPGTDVWQKEVEKAIDQAAIILVCLSPNVIESKWVRNEITRAEKRDKRVYTVLIDGDSISSVPLSLEGAQFVDLRQNDRLSLDGLVDKLKEELEIYTVQTPYIYQLWKKDGWQRSRLEEIATFCRPRPNDGSEDYPVYGNALGVDRHESRYDYDGSSLLIGEFPTSAGKIHMKKVSERFCTQRSVHVLKAEEIMLDFIIYTLQVTDLSPYITDGPAQQRVRLREVEIAVPPPDKLKAYVGYLNEQAKLHESQRAKLARQLHILEDRSLGVIYRTLTDT